jgi:hypothetical protein
VAADRGLSAGHVACGVDSRGVTSTCHVIIREFHIDRPIHSASCLRFRNRIAAHL